MRKNKVVEEWVRKAKDDLIVAKLSLKSKDKIYWATCFHAQQSAEKYLKAFLISVGVAPPKTHDTPELVALCAGIDEEFSTISPDARFLSAFSVEVRYPLEMEPSAKEAEKSLKAASRIERFVLTKIR
ncbi:MAG: HEPN domain-containing protein [Bacteroidota bacterium]